MLDIKLIREQPELVKAGIARRGDDPAIVDLILGLDTRRRELLNQVENLKATRNAVSKAIGKMKDLEDALMRACFLVVANGPPGSLRAGLNYFHR